MPSSVEEEKRLRKNKGHRAYRKRQADKLPKEILGKKKAAAILRAKKSRDGRVLPVGFTDPTGIGRQLPQSVMVALQMKAESDGRSDQKFAGDADTSVIEKRFDQLHAFIPPAAEKTCIMHYLLVSVSDFLGRPGMYNSFIEHEFGFMGKDTSDGAGVRTINGNRLEIFLDGAEKSTGAMEEILKRMITTYGNNGESPMGPHDAVTVRESLVRYANVLATRDQRIGDGTTMEFSGHAIIVSYSGVDAQDIHIDLDTANHYQFGVIMTGQVRATLEYTAVPPVLQTSALLSTIWDDMPAGLAEKLKRNTTIQSSLNRFGCLLSDQKIAGNSTDQELLFPAGTLISLPGMVPHGGPPARGFRAILFFTGAPQGSVRHDVDLQTTRTTLVGDMLLHSWLSLNVAERKFLLGKWYKDCLMKDTKLAINNVMHIQLKKIGVRLMSTGRKQDRTFYINHFAEYRWIKSNWMNGNPSYDRYVLPVIEKIGKKKRK